MTGWYWSYFPSSRNWNNPHRNKEFLDGAIIPANGFYLIGLSGYPETGGLVNADWQVYDSSQISSQKGSVAIFPWDPTIKTPEEVKDGSIDVLGWGNVDYVYESSAILLPVQSQVLTRSINGWDTDNNSSDFVNKDWPTPHNSQGEKAAIIADSSVFNQDIVWGLVDSPYILKSNSKKYPTVKSGATLFIEPGVVIKGKSKNYPSLVVKGGLRAQGTSANPIVFTAATTTPQAGNWAGIVFDNTDQESILEYVNFEYGGHRSPYKNGGTVWIEGMLWVRDSQIIIKKSTFKNSLNDGVYLTNSVFSISDSIFQDNTSTALIIAGEELSFVDNCRFENNNTGIEILNKALTIIKDNVFSDNHYPILIKSAYPSFSNNQANDNNLNGIIIHQDSVFNEDVVWTSDLPYILYSNSGDYPTVASGTSLTLDPGVIVKPHSDLYTILLIEGELIAQGAIDAPIIFTSIKDDDCGGDTNGDNANTTPVAGDWKNIKFEAGSSGEFNHVRH